MVNIIDSYQFGQIVVSGQKYTSDVIIVYPPKPYRKRVKPKKKQRRIRNRIQTTLGEIK